MNPSAITPARAPAMTAKANTVRAERARIRAELRRLPSAEARERCAALLEDPPPELRTMDVVALLRAVRELGPCAVDRLMRRAGVRPLRRVGELTPRQQRALVADLRAGLSPG